MLSGLSTLGNFNINVRIIYTKLILNNFCLLIFTTMYLTEYI